ncbi:MAG: PP2C family protein-serine/threonine phosphatase [Planctomycetota bacterium]|nr:PP2C family protein-serine/threonine phosphatase [Planctomycetota bacterium]
MLETAVRKARLAWVSQDPIPAPLLQAVENAWDVVVPDPAAPLAGQLAGAAVALVCPDGWGDDPVRMGAVLTALEASNAVGVFLMDAGAHVGRQILRIRGGQFVCLDAAADPGEIRAELAAAAALQPTIRRLRQQLAALEKTGGHEHPSLEELDEQIRLAAKLQQDFLPGRLPEVGPVRFGALYRPYRWVSGDIYDVARLDELHVGLYVVDAVGHGLPAALLTMFIKKALQTKRIIDHSYEIVPPHLALEELNADICEQDLPSCQFCSAVYAVVNTRTLELTYCRAGHPVPVVFHADGTWDCLDAPGALLGVAPHQEFSSSRYQLTPGDRVVLYTDGAEDSLRPGGTSGEPESFARLIEPWAALPREQMLLQLVDLFESRSRAGAVRDDVTLVLLDVEK